MEEEGPPKPRSQLRAGATAGEHRGDLDFSGSRERRGLTLVSPPTPGLQSPSLAKLSKSQRVKEPGNGASYGTKKKVLEGVSIGSESNQAVSWHSR